MGNCVIQYDVPTKVFKCVYLHNHGIISNEYRWVLIAGVMLIAIVIFFILLDLCITASSGMLREKEYEIYLLQNKKREVQDELKRIKNPGRTYY